MRSAGRRFSAAAALLMLGGALLAGYAWSAARFPAPADSVSGGLQPDARPGVILRVRYRMCGHAVQNDDSAPLGRAIDDVIRDHPDATVVMLPSGLADVTVEADGLCPDDAPYRLLTVSDGYVAVYYGRSPVRAALKEIRRDLPVGRLNPSDVSRLERGELVLGDAAVSRLLEGLLD